MHKYATALWILVLLTAVGCETISANGDGAAKQWWQDDGDVKTTSLEPVLGSGADIAWQVVPYNGDSSVTITEDEQMGAPVITVPKGRVLTLNGRTTFPSKIDVRAR